MYLEQIDNIYMSLIINYLMMIFTALKSAIMKESGNRIISIQKPRRKLL